MHSMLSEFLFDKLEVVYSEMQVPYWVMVNTVERN